MTAPLGTPSSGPAFAPARWGRHPAVRAIALSVGGVISVVILGIATFVLANLFVRTSETRAHLIRGDIERVVVQVTGEVTITPGPDGRARVERRSDFGFRRPDVTHAVADGVLTVKATCGNLGFCHNNVDLTIPRTARVDVSADLVHVSGISGRVTIDSDSGSVRLARLSGPIDVRVGGGEVRGTDLTSDEVRASAGAGSIELSFRRPPRNVDTTAGAGQVLIELPRDETRYRVDADSGAGHRDVKVATARTSDHVIRAYAGAGQVTIRYDVR